MEIFLGSDRTSFCFVAKVYGNDRPRWWRGPANHLRTQPSLSSPATASSFIQTVANRRKFSANFSAAVDDGE